MNITMKLTLDGLVRALRVKSLILRETLPFRTQKQNLGPVEPVQDYRPEAGR